MKHQIKLDPRNKACLPVFSLPFSYLHRDSMGLGPLGKFQAKPSSCCPLGPGSRAPFPGRRLTRFQDLDILGWSTGLLCACATTAEENVCGLQPLPASGSIKRNHWSSGSSRVHLASPRCLRCGSNCAVSMAASNGIRGGGGRWYCIGDRERACESRVITSHCQKAHCCRHANHSLSLLRNPLPGFQQ